MIYVFGVNDGAAKRARQFSKSIPDVARFKVSNSWFENRDKLREINSPTQIFKWDHVLVSAMSYVVGLYAATGRSPLVYGRLKECCEHATKIVVGELANIEHDLYLFDLTRLCNQRLYAPSALAVSVYKTILEGMEMDITGYGFHEDKLTIAPDFGDLIPTVTRSSGSWVSYIDPTYEAFIKNLNEPNSGYKHSSNSQLRFDISTFISNMLEFDFDDCIFWNGDEFDFGMTIIFAQREYVHDVFELVKKEGHSCISLLDTKEDRISLLDSYKYCIIPYDLKDNQFQEIELKCSIVYYADMPFLTRASKCVAIGNTGKFYKIDSLLVPAKDVSMVTHLTLDQLDDAECEDYYLEESAEMELARSYALSNCLGDTLSKHILDIMGVLAYAVRRLD